ncbi:MAG: cation transporter [Armatimonadetes bacterium]|nr:cation transporter [Armatimonadota bacterium]
MSTALSIVGTAFGALGASACCWIPAALGAGAAGSLGVSAALVPWRPYLLGLTAVFLAFGFYFAYRRPKEASCKDGVCEADGGRLKRRIRIGVLWFVALFAIGMAAYPNVLAARADMGSAPEATAANAHEVTLNIKGMDCAGCAVPIKENLEKVLGVTSAAIDFENATATVWVNEPAPDSEALLQAVRDAGFDAETSK